MTALTTEQAADHLGVSPTTIRGWVMQGKLEPVRRGAKPLLFRLTDVENVRSARQSSEWHSALDDLAARWERECLETGL